MPDTTDTHIGVNLREMRKRRGLTQRDVAQASGVSLSLIRKLEQGEVRDTRLETAHRLARTLRVPTSRLLRRDEDSADEVTVDQWAPVRAALLAPPGSAMPDQEPTVTGVREALAAAQPLFSGDQFSELATVLPRLLRDADALGGDGQARAVRVRLLQLTGWLLVQTRQYEAAAAALQRALDDAGDRLEGAATVNTLCWLHLRTGRLSEARELAVRWADDTEPRMSRATPTELSAWGWMLLRVSAAAVRDNEPGQAKDALRLARSAAVALGREYAPDSDFLRTFGPVTVILKRAENAAVADQPDQVLKIAEGIPQGGLRPTSNNRNRHLLDVADAHAKTRSYGEAVSVLQGIRADSPEWLPQQRYARDIMDRVVGKRRTLTPEMRELANALTRPM